MNMSDKDKIAFIDKIIALAPEIKKKRSLFLNQLVPQKAVITDEYVLERVSINNVNYYKDKYKAILNVDADLVGVWEWSYNDNNFKYHIFEEGEKNIVTNQHTNLKIDENDD